MEFSYQMWVRGWVGLVTYSAHGVPINGDVDSDVVEVLEVLVVVFVVVFAGMSDSRVSFGFAVNALWWLFDEVCVEGSHLNPPCGTNSSQYSIKHTRLKQQDPMEQRNIFLPSYWNQC
jgi:hypothetical protein